MFDGQLRIVIILVLGVAATTLPQGPTTTMDLPDISIDSLMAHVSFLSSDALAGRATGSQGGELAAHYIAYYLRRYQIAAMQEFPDYFQYVPMHGSKPLPSCKLFYHHNQEVYSFVYADDYVLYKSGAQTFIPNPLPLHFVGYGIIAPEFDYNDYANIDVTDKIVVYLSGEPPSDDPHYFNGPLPSVYSLAESKARLAISRGARGSILIPNPIDELAAGWQRWRRDFLFEDVVLASTVASHFSLAMNPQAAQVLFGKAQHSLAEVLHKATTHALYSFPLRGAISFRGEFKQREFMAKNVIGWIDGTHPRLKNEFLVLSAHYDHLGIGEAVQGDSIYNGVGDNAMGVAALIEIARVLKQQAQKLQRSVIFLFTTGEEKALLGASYFLDHSPVPNYRIVANINIDGLAMFDEFNSVVGVGAELSELGDALQRLVHANGLKLEPIPPEFTTTESFSHSDQMAFAHAGIPSILIMEGTSFRRLTREQGIAMMIHWISGRYHTPFDDLSQPIFWPAAKQHSCLIYELAWHLSQTKEKPQWYPGSPYINARLRSIAKKL